MTSTVAVIGGGYGGITVAEALDEIADVRLIEPRDTFVHNVAALRAVADPTWIDQMFLPYDGLLTHGKVVRDSAALVEPNAVTLGSGERVEADYIVLATGSHYPFPAKVDQGAAAPAAARFRALNQQLASVKHVLLLGAGPVGLELAGEIKAVWPDKDVTILDPADQLVSGDYPADFRAELGRQLDSLGVNLRLGTSLAAEPPGAPAVAGAFAVNTTRGETINADIWFRCHGTQPTSDYLSPQLASARQADGHIRVTDRLSLPGTPNVFAIGDVTAIPESKRAQAAAAHAQVVATNIGALIAGGDATATYEAAPDAIVLPLGPKGGASYTPAYGVMGASQTSEIKGRDLFIGRYRSVLGLDEPTPKQEKVATGSDGR